MKYFYKYLKYKKKYLDLLGGAIPHIKDDFPDLLTLENKDINIFYQGRIILKNNDDICNNYLLNDNYEFVNTKLEIKKPLFDILKLSLLANLNIKLGNKFIPFHIGTLHFNFSIITGLIEYLLYVNKNIKLPTKKQKEKFSIIINSFRQYISSNIFYIDMITNTFLGISQQNNILNCFSFFNKLHEFLNYILLNKYDEQTINQLFPNIENIKDFYNLYHFFYLIKDNDRTVFTVLQLEKEIDEFYKDIINFKQFIYNCNIIDRVINFEGMFNISLINLILINWIYLRSLRTNIVIGSLSSNLYPINVINFFENIFQMDEKQIYCYAKQQEELNEEKDINNLLLVKMNIPIISYSQSVYKGNIFSNCVENTILQILKILAWDSGKYNINLLPKGINKKLTDILERINLEPSLTESKEIMDDFVALISGGEHTDIKLKNLKYRNVQQFYNIISNTENIGNLLNYIFNNETTKEGISDYNIIFDKINSETQAYSIKHDINMIIIKKNGFIINAIIKNGHAFIDYKDKNIYKLINTYEYSNIIYTFNYTKGKNINFDRNFINFGHKQDQKMKDFLTDKIINIQGINIQLDLFDDEGCNCVHIACILDNGEKLKEFLKIRRGYINVWDNEGKPPILYASEYGSINCIQILIDNGVDINEYNQILNETALSISMLNDTTDCFEFLIKNVANVDQLLWNETTLFKAIKRKKFDYVRLLIVNGADVNFEEKLIGSTPLIVACKHSTIEIIELLINDGANINHANRENNTSLTISTKLLRVDVVKLLVSRGANINLGSPFNLLINQIYFYFFDDKEEDDDESKYNRMMLLIRFFIETGANINAPYTNGEKPLSIAKRTNDRELIDLLIKNGAVL